MADDNPSQDAIEQSPVQAIAEVLSEIKETLVGVKDELIHLRTDGSARVKEEEEETASTTTPATEEPTIEATPPTEEFRMVRRGHRKVKRKVQS